MQFVFFQFDVCFKLTKNWILYVLCRQENYTLPKTTLNHLNCGLNCRLYTQTNVQTGEQINIT